MINKIFFLTFFFVISIQAVHELGSYERMEEIDGMIFKQKVFYDGTEIIRDFFIDDEPVAHEIFEQRKYDAAEHEVQRAQQRLKNMVEQEEKIFESFRRKGYITLIKQERECLESLLSKIYEESIRPFWVFDENTVSSEELLHRIKEHLLPSLMFIDDSDVAKESISTLKNLFEKLEKLCQILSPFYQQTIALALEQSDDPSALKKLLELKE